MVVFRYEEASKLNHPLKLTGINVLEERLHLLRGVGQRSKVREGLCPYFQDAQNILSPSKAYVDVGHSFWRLILHVSSLLLA
jgi:hypothetical protein